MPAVFTIISSCVKWLSPTTSCAILVGFNEPSRDEVKTISQNFGGSIFNTVGGAVKLWTYPADP